ncbi:MAG: MBL fold metallo-hydrolase, partial [Anaerolineae bacterium]|nr:MBL fold metallo-hydrolase [Anaerolineae bacterium]
DDNYIWLISCRGNPHVAIVDPGDADPVIKRVEQDALEPVAILITHHHGDHTGGVNELVQRYKIPVYGPAHESIPSITQPVGEGNTVILDECGLRFRILDTP